MFRSLKGALYHIHHEHMRGKKIGGKEEVWSADEVGTNALGADREALKKKISDDGEVICPYKVLLQSMYNTVYWALQIKITS